MAKAPLGVGALSVVCLGMLAVAFLAASLGHAVLRLFVLAPIVSWPSRSDFMLLARALVGADPGLVVR
jgi:uncharacterized membrane protein